MKDKGWGVRNTAADALGKLDEKTATTEVLQTLLALLKDKEGYVRCVAAKALGKLGEKATTGEIIQGLMAIKNDIESIKALFKLPLFAILQHYLRSPVTFFWGVNKKYAQAVATLLLRSGYLLYDKAHKELILLDGQTHRFSLTTSEHTKLAQALVECLHEQAKVFGLPLMVTAGILKKPDAYPLSEVADVPVPQVTLRSQPPAAVVAASLTKGIAEVKKEIRQVHREQKDAHKETQKEHKITQDIARVTYAHVSAPPSLKDV